MQTRSLAPPQTATDRPERRALTLTISCFLVWGLAYGLLDVLNKHFQETVHVGKAQSAWLQMAYFGAYLLLSLPAGLLLEKRGYKFGLVLALGVTAGGALLFIPSARAASFPFFVAAMFVFASGLCLLETAADTYVNVLGPPEAAPRRLNLAQSFNALGVFLGPLIGGVLFFDNQNTAGPGGGQQAVQLVYLLIAAAVAILAVIMSRARLPESPQGRLAHDSPLGAGAEPVPLWRRRHFAFGVAAQALYVGAQVGIGAFFINLVTETWPGLTSRGGAFMLSQAALGYLVGRFTSTWLLRWHAPRALLTVYALVNVLLCLVVAAGLPRISPIALMGTFLFMSTMFPTIFALGVSELGPRTKRGSSIMVMAVGGGVLLPWPMGRIAELYGTPSAFLLPAACFAVIGLYGWMGAERPSRD